MHSINWDNKHKLFACKREKENEEEKDNNSLLLVVDAQSSSAKEGHFFLYPLAIRHFWRHILCVLIFLLPLLPLLRLAVVLPFPALIHAPL